VECDRTKREACDPRLAKEVEFALPRELPCVTWLATARADVCTAKGFEDGTGQSPHPHLLMTTRVIAGKSVGPNVGSADGRQFVLETRSLKAHLDWLELDDDLRDVPDGPDHERSR
jgi:hypothetical protein